MGLSKPSPRRRHGADLKARVLAECAKPGASVAAVALEHGLNANLVHRWRRLAAGDAPARSGLEIAPAPFLPVAMAAAPAPADIRIELRRGATSVTVSWPQAAAADCGAWLRELLR
jgi:transposase